MDEIYNMMEIPITLTDDKWKEFNKLLEALPRYLPNLKKLLTEFNIFDEDN